MVPVNGIWVKKTVLYHNGRQLLQIPGGGDVEEKRLDKLWDRIKDKVRCGIDDNTDIMELNGNKYIDQMVINIILIEKIKKMEAKLAKIR